MLLQNRDETAGPEWAKMNIGLPRVARSSRRLLGNSAQYLELREQRLAPKAQRFRFPWGVGGPVGPQAFQRPFSAPTPP